MPSKVRSAKEGLRKTEGKTIQVLVGKNREAFTVHENSICSSPFFEKALSGEWKESSSRTVELPDDEPGIFSIYVRWLCSGTLSVRATKPPWDDTFEVQNFSLVKAYVLGDKILDAKFQDACIDGLIENTDALHISPENRKHPAGEIIEYAYNNTCESAMIRKVLVDIFAVQGCAEWLDSSSWNERSRIPQSFLLDLSSTLLSRRGKPYSDTVHLDPLKYHLCEPEEELVSESEW